MTGPVVALSTVATAEDAERIARSLVEKGVAACVNVVPGVVSFYRWKGRLERDAEVLLVIKTRGERFEALKAALLAEHPYEVPELVALPIAGGHERYRATSSGWRTASAAERSGARAFSDSHVRARSPGSGARVRAPLAPRGALCLQQARPRGPHPAISNKELSAR